MEEHVEEIVDETIEPTDDIELEQTEDGIQTTFNTDSIDVLVEEGEVENVYTENE